MLTLKDVKKVVKNRYNPYSAEEVQLVSRIILVDQSFKDESELMLFLIEIEKIWTFLDNSKK